jgi:hypothetical protein
MKNSLLDKLQDFGLDTESEVDQERALEIIASLENDEWEQALYWMQKLGAQLMADRIDRNEWQWLQQKAAA